MEIVVIESGFVYIGSLEKVNHPILGECVVINDAKNIRRWGTERGLGQLAAFGKQEKTELDFYGTVTVPFSKILHIINVTEEAEKTFTNE